MNARRVRTLTGVALAVALATLLAGCGAFGGDQNTFNPGGDVAERQRDLFLLGLWPAIVILMGVLTAVVYIVVRFRRREGDEMPKQVHGNNRLEIAWTIAPLFLLAFIAVPTVDGIIDLGRAADDDALHVRVVAFQWDWRFQYLDAEYADADGNPLTVPDLYIPVDRQIGVELQAGLNAAATDVIHSFWVPKLAGKQDVMPGRTNRMWFNATEAGVYSGQCAEFCGIGHAVMKFTVTAVEPAEFESWAEEQLAGQ